ncbi:MAG: hypothetical protein P4M11_14755 [Candidatus Pacebacteria bacterium]|nr:hypothetical protein [Candidatus Paceibacterota bacterium]
MGRFDGKKSIVLSTANSLGGKNYILGGFFIAVAGLSFLLCAIFLVAYKVKHSKETAISISERR